MGRLQYSTSSSNGNNDYGGVPVGDDGSSPCFECLRVLRHGETLWQ